jgi:diguanylate cyclase (GGDEF)-like protein/PAS domain S-box-containing protein
MDKINRYKDNWRRKLFLYNACIIGAFVIVYLFIGDNDKLFFWLLIIIILFIFSFALNVGMHKEIHKKRMIENALKQSEALYRGVINNAAAGIALLNQDGHYHYVNATLCQMTGFSQEELKRLTLFDSIVPEERQESVMHCREVWEGKDAWKKCEKQFRCKDGQSLWAEINLSTVCDSGDNVIHLIMIVLDITVRKKLEKELLYQATTDFLTGIDNRLAFMQKAQEEFSRSERYKRNFTMLLIDIDKFKSVNDQYGHLVGDRVLKEVVKAFKLVLREMDVLARIGGEEFAVIPVESDLMMAQTVAERIQQKVLDVVVEMENTEKIQVSVSIGIAEKKELDLGVDDIFKRADDALYEAKNTGRNRIVVGNELVEDIGVCNGNP